MASSKIQPAALLLLLVAAVLASSSAAASDYCRDSLDGLTACDAFMYGGAPAASPDCCTAYSGAFNANPFCLCYIANGVYGRSTGSDVNVTHAMEIPTSCGQLAPPIELCGMEGLVLPPYAPEKSTTEVSSSPAPAAAQQPSAAAAAGPATEAAPQSSPSFTSVPPPPPPTSGGDRDSGLQMAVVLFFAGVVALTM